MTRISSPQNVGALGWIGFYGLILAAWSIMLAHSVSAPSPELAETFGADYWRALCEVTAAEARFLTVFGMWAAMAAAMMAPTILPALRIYAGLPRPSDATENGVGEFLALNGGYLSVWIGFAVLAAALQIWLADALLIDARGASLSTPLSGFLLGLAGLYQFSTLKQNCLSRCQSPLTFFMRHWRPGAAAAWRMGARLGFDCLGCCWALMLLGFVFGVMSLVWMTLALVLMTLEKLPEIGGWLTRPLGYLLLAGMLWRIWSALT